MTDNFLKWIIENNAIQRGKEFVTKSGKIFNYETDLREALKTHRAALKTSSLILDLMTFKDLKQFDCFIGVPETGTLLAFYLNQAKYEVFGNDFPINIVRAVEKKYQASTHSTKSVLPLIEELKVILVEDDVVSGKTLLNTIEGLKGSNFNIIEIISIIDRDEKLENGKSLKQHIKEEYNLEYRSLLSYKLIKEYMEKNNENL